MTYRVSVRINARTGEFELFQVDDLDPAAEPAEHNDRHEEVSETVGRLVARRPEVEEIQPAERGPDELAVPPLVVEVNDTPVVEVDDTTTVAPDRLAQES